MDSVLKKAKEKMGKSIVAFEDELGAIRTGRASAAMFDKIMVDYYGQKTPINQVGTISVPEARLVVIQPWDQNALNDIEKAIQTSDLSLNPSNDGKVIRINIPPLTEERRKELVKMVKTTAENSRVAVRNIRRDMNDELKKLQKGGDISEDDLKKGMEDIQKLTDEYIKKINGIFEKKEKEIMEV